MGKIKQNYLYHTKAYAKLDEYAEAIRGIVDGTRILTTNTGVISLERGNDILENVSEKYCKYCDRKGICWSKELSSTYKAVSVMMKKGIVNGEVHSEDLPRNFLIRCKNIHAMLLEFNAGLKLEKNNLRWVQVVHDIKDIMSMQMLELADSLFKFNEKYNNLALLDAAKEKLIKAKLKRAHLYVRDIYMLKNSHGLNEVELSIRTRKDMLIKSAIVVNVVSKVMGVPFELSKSSRETISNSLCEIVLVEKHVYEIKTYFKGLKKEGEIICGDNYAHFQGECGQNVLLLSDGMGCGADAYNESKHVVEGLESLFCAGFSAESAIKLVNSMLYMNSFGSDRYATVDVCLIDVYTGECRFIKYGSPPSFIKRDNEVIMISDETFPIGVFSSTVYVDQSIQLREGDIIIMYTDGLLEAMDNKLESIDVIRGFLLDCNTKNPAQIGKQLLENCIDDRTVRDDISVLVGSMWKNI